MRVWKAVLLMNLALALGLGVGWLWWGRQAQRLAQDLEAARHLPRMQRDLVQRVIAAGLCVQRSAQLLYGEVQRERAGIAARSAEQHVFQEVRQPVRGRRLVSRPGAHVEADAGRVEVRRFDCQKPEAVGEPGTRDAVGRLSKLDGCVHFENRLAGGNRRKNCAVGVNLQNINFHER